MSITSESNRTEELVTDGVETDFDFLMLIHADTELQVWYKATSGSYTRLILDTHYTVVFTEDGGTVTTIGADSPYAAGAILIIRHLALTQQTNWFYNDNHTSQQHQDDFDRSVMRDLQIQEQLDRSVGFAIHSDTSDVEFPEPSADNIIGWNSTGDALENKDFIEGMVIPTLTPGSVLFANVTGIISQDNDELFWDDTNKMLGIGTDSPARKLDIRHGSMRFSNLYAIEWGSFAGPLIYANSLTHILNIDRCNVIVNGAFTTKNSAGDVIFYVDEDEMYFTALAAIATGNPMPWLFWLTYTV